MTFSIRPMTREDLDQVNTIDREAFPTQWPPANYLQELQNRIAHYLVVTDDERLLEPGPPKHPSGLYRLVKRLFNHQETEPRQPPSQLYIAGFTGIWMMADEAHITNIAVRQEYRGNGIGGLLLIATYDLARELKASFLTLEARVSNTVAQELYTRYGFKQTGLRKGYYLDNKEDAIIMSTEGLDSSEMSKLMSQLRESLKGKLHSPTAIKQTSNKNSTI